MLAIRAYCDRIMLNAFATYYAHNYAGIIGSSLVHSPYLLTSLIPEVIIQTYIIPLSQLIGGVLVGAHWSSHLASFLSNGEHA